MKRRRKNRLKKTVDALFHARWQRTFDKVSQLEMLKFLRLNLGREEIQRKMNRTKCMNCTSCIKDKNWMKDWKRRYEKKRISKEFVQVFNAFKIQMKMQVVKKTQMNEKRSWRMKEMTIWLRTPSVIQSLNHINAQKYAILYRFSMPFRVAIIPTTSCSISVLCYWCFIYLTKSQEEEQMCGSRAAAFLSSFCVHCSYMYFAHVSIKLTQIEVNITLHLQLMFIKKKQ